MYNISQLNEMADSELKSVAEAMGIKKIDLSQKEDLIYNILDQQAIDRAASGAAVSKRRPDSERGRAAGKTNDNKDKQDSEESAPAPKKRGRKAKNQPVQQAAAEQAPVAAKVAEKPAAEDQPAVEAKPVEAAAPQQKRRGRPRKVDVAAAKSSAEVTEMAEPVVE